MITQCVVVHSMPRLTRRPQAQGSLPPRVSTLRSATPRSSLLIISSRRRGTIWQGFGPECKRRHGNGPGSAVRKHRPSVGGKAPEPASPSGVNCHRSDRIRVLYCVRQRPASPPSTGRWRPTMLLSCSGIITPQAWRLRETRSGSPLLPRSHIATRTYLSYMLRSCFNHRPSTDSPIRTSSAAIHRPLRMI